MHIVNRSIHYKETQTTGRKGMKESLWVRGRGGGGSTGWGGVGDFIQPIQLPLPRVYPDYYPIVLEYILFRVSIHGYLYTLFCFFATWCL